MKTLWTSKTNHLGKKFRNETKANHVKETIKDNKLLKIIIKPTKTSRSLQEKFDLPTENKSYIQNSSVTNSRR